MKKCPECGTILDDSKKKCYMCGADLLKKNPMSFMDSFDDNVGAAVTKGQDNVFNGVPNISVKVNDVVNKSNENVTFSSSSSSANFFKEQMGDKLNGPSNEASINKILNNNEKYKNDPGIDAKEAIKKNEVQNNNGFSPGSLFGSGNKQSDNQNIMPNNVNPPAPPSQPPINQVNNISTGFFQNNNQNSNFNNQVNEQKPSINWGNNLVDSNKNNKEVSKYKDKVSKKFNLNISFIFNTVCFFLFLGALIFIYFKFIKQNDAEIVKLGGLSYIVPENFMVNTDDNFSKFYKYGDNCTMRISYSSILDTNSAVDDYYEEVQNSYANQNGLSIQKNVLNIDGNSWTEISVMELQENPSGVGGYSSLIKYRFVTIVYNADFYELKYVNNNNDNACSAMYNEIINSLAFD